MAQYNTLNVKLSNLQLDKLKSVIKRGTEVTLKLSSNIIGDFNDENNFRHKLSLTNTQVLRLRKALANNFPAKIKLSKTQSHKIGQLGGLSGRVFGPLLKNGSALMKDVLQPLARIFLKPLRLTIKASATDAAIYTTMFE